MGTQRVQSSQFGNDILQNSSQLNNAPKDIHILISGTYRYTALLGKCDFVDVLKLSTLRQSSYPGIFERAKVIKSDQSQKKELWPQN